MLNFPIGLASMLLSAVESWMADGVGDGPLRAGNTPMMPRDPSTLKLALIGVGTIAIYLAVRRSRWLRGEAPAATGRSSNQSIAGRASVELEERPSRGAA